MEGSNRLEGKEYELMQRVLKLWERYKPLCLERLCVIEEAYAVAESATLDNESTREGRISSAQAGRCFRLYWPSRRIQDSKPNRGSSPARE